MSRCDYFVTSYMDFESLIEVLGCSARFGEIHPAVSETVVHGESYLMTGGTCSYSDRQVDHYRGLVDNASRVKGALSLGIDTVLSAMVLTIASRSRSKSLA